MPAKEWTIVTVVVLRDSDDINLLMQKNKEHRKAFMRPLLYLKALVLKIELYHTLSTLGALTLN